MTIKNLVISGGGPIMLQILGAIQQLEKEKFLNIEDIESIYGTSAGALIGALICLKFDWETVNDYIIKRPWHEVFTINVQTILEAYYKKGIYDNKIIEKCFKPLFAAKDISMDINLSDFYKFSNIELHFFSFEINEYKVQDISYLTHPDLSLITAIQMTCALPVLLTPVFIDSKCFIDGGLSSNYPLKYCIESGKNPDEILGFKNNYIKNNSFINSESTLLDFLLNFLYKAIFCLNTDESQPSIKNEFICNADYITLDNLKKAISNIEIRKDLFNDGQNQANTFLSKLENSV